MDDLPEFDIPEIPPIDANGNLVFPPATKTINVGEIEIELIAMKGLNRHLVGGLQQALGLISAKKKCETKRSIERTLAMVDKLPKTTPCPWGDGTPATSPARPLTPCVRRPGHRGERVTCPIGSACIECVVELRGLALDNLIDELTCPDCDATASLDEVATHGRPVCLCWVE